MGIPFFKTDVFRTFGVENRQSHELLRDESSARRHYNKSEDSEKRSRHRIISPKQIREMERILKEKGMKGRSLIWEQLGYEIDLKCNGRTVKQVMRTMKYHKCIACKKEWVNEFTAKRKVE